MFHNTPTFEKGMDLVMACITLIISRICAYKKVPYSNDAELVFDILKISQLLPTLTFSKDRTKSETAGSSCFLLTFVFAWSIFIQ